MKKYILIERESLNQKDKLPVMYKKMQYDLDNIANHNKVNDTMHVKSIRHQTTLLEAVRFYKNIELFSL